MYNFSTVYDAFKTLVGFENSNNINIENVSVVNNTADSGLYYNDIAISQHLTLEKLYNTFNKDEYENFNDFLAAFDKSAIQKALNHFKRVKELQKAAKTLIEDQTAFEGVSKETHNSKDVFFGWRIRPRFTEGLKVVLHKIAITLIGNQSDLPIYLYHSSKTTAIATTTIASITANNFTWNTLVDWECKYSDPSYQSGGVFYIGFFGSDLDTLVFPVSHNVPSRILLYADVCPFTIDSQYHNGTGLFTIGDAEENINFDKTLSQGISLNMSTKVDLTDYFIRHKYEFTELIRYSGHVLAVELLLNGTEETPISTQGKRTAIFELTELKDDKNSLLNRFEEEAKAIDFNFSDLDTIATPDSKGYTYQ